MVLQTLPILIGKGSSNWLWSTWVQSHSLSFLTVQFNKIVSRLLFVLLFLYIYIYIYIYSWSGGGLLQEWWRTTPSVS